MWVVAVTELAAPLDVEASALASDLGVVAYEARMRLGGGLPAIVLTTPDVAKARELAAKLRNRRHGAVAIDDELVIPRDQMVSMRRFRVEGTEIVGGERGDDRLPFDDVFALLRASHRVHTETRVETKEKKVSVGRAMVTAGLSMTKKVGVETIKHATDREQVLYLFRRSGRPWLLREKGAYYQGLGERMGISQHENFARAVQMFREWMPSATYDDRLLHVKRVPERTLRAAAKSDAASNADGMDLLAHIQATWVYERSQSMPYRM
jgi:hypothetical protein